MQIRRLQVAMQNSRSMRRCQSLGKLDSELNDFLLGYCTRTDAHVKRGAGNQFGHQIVMAFERVKIVDGLYRRMVQPRKNKRLVAEALSRCFVVERTWCDDFDREPPLQLFVIGAIDHTHAAGTDLLLDAVPSETFTHLRHAPSLWREMVARRKQSHQLPLATGSKGKLKTSAMALFAPQG